MTAPEALAKKALLDLLDERFDGRDDVRVSYGPPPTDSAEPHQVWVGGHDFDDQFATMRGAAGPAIDSQLSVQVVVDSLTSAAEPPLLESSALELTHEVRGTVAQAITDRVEVGPGIRWSRVGRGASDGPLPVDGGGWVETVNLDVMFTTRIRGGPQ